MTERRGGGRVGVGDPAPDFELPDAEGRPVRLSSFRGRPVVLYFYPADFTTVCTIEACTFRDEYTGFREAGAEVLGVSTDPPERHGRFAARHRLPFTLLSDPDDTLRPLYGVGKQWLIPGRATFVIDPKGIVRHVFRSQWRGRRHVEEALEAVRRLAEPQAAGAPRGA